MKRTGYTMEIHLHPSGKSITCLDDENLLPVLLKAGLPIDNNCNGKSKCGKCKIQIISGALSEATETEKELLTAEELCSGIRLACLTKATDNLTLSILTKERRNRVLTSGYLPDFKPDFYAGGLGVVIDLGTTTVAASLIDLSTGAELSVSSMLNPQKTYGLDVLTRISYEYEYPDTGVKLLQSSIVNALNEMLEELCQIGNADKTEIREIIVAANCTMLHMLLGVDARSIGKAPYRPVFTKAQIFSATDIGLVAGSDTELYCLPSVSSYIGADIVAGVYVCQLKEFSGNAMFIDIGTNGEIALSGKGKLLCCSCAAGPALEGMNISSGMRAADGAIENVSITPENIELTVIGGKSPEGICGSGILAAIKEMLQAEFIHKRGVFVKPDTLQEDDFRLTHLAVDGTKRSLVLHAENPRILITQKDVRQVQLAKGALLSGFKALLDKAQIDMEDLDKVLVAGQFGAHLSVESLVGTGILPDTLKDKISYVGNTSMTGAYMALMSKKIKEEIDALSEQMEYMELAETENYERILADCLVFP